MKQTRKHRPPPQVFCSRCGHSERHRRWEITHRGSRVRCSRCGGNYVLRRELPSETLAIVRKSEVKR